MIYKKGDIVVVPFPFNDRQAFKKRPAVIFSNLNHHIEYGKYICLAITSQEKAYNAVRCEHKLLETTSVGLLYEAQWVLPNKVFSIENKLVLKKLGTLNNKDFTIVETMFNDILR